MFSYDKLWVMLKERKISWYTIVCKHGISPSTIQRIKHNQSVSVATIDKLCGILGCDIGDIVSHVPDDTKDLDTKKEPDAE